MTEANGAQEADPAAQEHSPAAVPADEKRPQQQEEQEEEKKKENGSAGQSGSPEVEFVHPEGGWGWIVMLASMWCNGSVFGIQNAFGILFLYILREFGSEKDEDLRFRAGGSLRRGGEGGTKGPRLGSNSALRVVTLLLSAKKKHVFGNPVIEKLAAV